MNSDFNFNSAAKLTLDGEEYTLRIASDVVVPEAFCKKLASKMLNDYEPGDIILFNYPSGILRRIEILNRDEPQLFLDRTFSASPTFRASSRKLA